MTFDRNLTNKSLKNMQGRDGPLLHLDAIMSDDDASAAAIISVQHGDEQRRAELRKSVRALTFGTWNHSDSRLSLHGIFMVFNA
jgi:hypothetical protein